MRRERLWSIATALIPESFILSYYTEGDMKGSRTDCLLEIIGKTQAILFPKLGQEALYDRDEDEVTSFF